MTKDEHDNEHHKHETHTAEHAKHADHASEEISEEKPVDSKRSLIIVLTIIGIIVVVIAGIILLSKYVFINNNSVIYNHYQFDKFEGNKWMTQQLIKNQMYNIPFYNNPTQVLDIAVDPNSITRVRDFSLYTNGTTYISVDPLANARVVLAGVEYARILGKVYNIYNMNVKSAVDQYVNDTVDTPVITCNNQSKDTLVIYQTITDKNLISVNGNCIILESKNATESIRVADAFAFRLLNIIATNQ